MTINIPLWVSHRNETTKRLYLRFQTAMFKPWRSGGRNADQSLKIYYRGLEVNFAVAITHGKVDYDCLVSSDY